MNIAGIILLGAGYLLGNPAARDKFGAAIQQFAGQGIDALNGLSKNQGEANAEQAKED